jgi:hypothetical protein
MFLQFTGSNFQMQIGLDWILSKFIHEDQEMQVFLLLLTNKVLLTLCVVCR